MTTSVFDLFSIGIGPSASHTVGPMRAARGFALELEQAGLLGRTTRVTVELFGSLGSTGRGHGTDGAVILGLEGSSPEDVDVATVEARVAAVRARGSVRLLRDDGHQLQLELVFHRRATLPFHPNGMRFAASGAASGEALLERTLYSVGGGFVVTEAEAAAPPVDGAGSTQPHPFTTAVELGTCCSDTGLSISQVMFENERARRSADEITDGLLRVWEVMQACVAAGIATDGTLPGALHVKRRAPDLYRHLTEGAASEDPLQVMDWVNLFAIAVNEENAAGGRVVTAPTNGAAGIIPAVLHYYRRFVPGASDQGVVTALLTAGAIGTLYKRNASISGAEVGCQGEVGAACSMAAAALCEVLGGTPLQVENAAEIGMEHNLGLTCDPVGGLVQIPCIERNAMAAVKAINAARIALLGDGTHVVSLDTVIETMRATGADMQVTYKETSRGGLAVNVIEC